MSNIIERFRLDGKVVLITGATSGIGRGIALACAEAGATVAAIGRNQEKLESLRTQLNVVSSRLHCCEVFDVADFENIPALVQKITVQCGRICGFVHSAGIVENSPLKVSSASLYKKILEVNSIAAFEFIKVISAKKFSGDMPSYVLVSSVSAVRGEPGLTAYSASKGALLAGCRAMAAELAAKKIRVNCILPGQVMDTEIGKYQTQTLDEESFHRLESAHPLGLGKVQDITGPVVFLLSEASQWITGSSLIIDGGYTL